MGLNRAQRRLHSAPRHQALGDIEPPRLARGARPVAERDRAAFELERPGFTARVSIPRRPTGWVLIAGGRAELETLDAGRYATLRVDRPRGGGWAEALAAAARWLSELPEARGLPLALAGAAGGRDAALAATAALGPRVDALVLDREARGPLVLTPTLVLDRDAVEPGAFLDAELGTGGPPGARPLTGRARRLLARRLERRLRRDCRRRSRGPLDRRVRAGLATLAAALALTLSLGLGAVPASAAVTSSVSGSNDLTVIADPVGSMIEIGCDGSDALQVNGGDPGTGPAACSAIASISVEGSVTSDSIDLGGVTAAEFTALSTLPGLDSDVTLDGSGGPDDMLGPADLPAVLEGGPGTELTRNTIVGGSADDVIDGSGGDDWYTGGPGSDTIGGGEAGTDRLTEDLAELGTTSVSLQNGSFEDGVDADSLTSIEEASLIGTAAADVVDASLFAHPVTVAAGGGDDSVSSYLDADSLLGEAGEDTLTSDFGNDTLEGGADGDSLLGLSGEDSIRGGGGADYMDGQFGPDSIVGETGDDTLVGGDSGVNTLFGGGGSDEILSGNGGDLYVAEASTDAVLTDDSFSDTADTDALLGGIAQVSLTGGATGSTFDASAFTNGPVTIDAAAGHDSVIGSPSADSLIGAEGSDTMTGNGGADVLSGADGPDSMSGDGGADTLLGAAQGDTLFGNAGADSLSGGADDDLHESQDGGTPDANDCGTGADVANLDIQDSALGCETTSFPGVGEPGGPAPDPPDPPADTTPPALGLSGKGKQRSRSKLEVEVSCDEVCTVDAGGTIKIPVIKKKKRGGSSSLAGIAKKKTYELSDASIDLAAGQERALEIKVTGKAKKKLKKAIKRKRSKATVSATARDAAGNRSGAQELAVTVLKKKR